MSVEIKLTPIYKVEVFEDGKRCNCSHGNDYARTKEEAYKLALEILNDSRTLDKVAAEVLKGNIPKVHFVPHNY